VETATEVRYAGVVVGRAAPLRDRDGAETFVLCAEPLPVGTPVSLKIEDAERAARVTEVVESADANLAGMRVRFVSETEAARPSGGPAKAPAPKPAPVTASPVVTAPVEAAPVVASPVAAPPAAPAPVEAPPAAPATVAAAPVEAVPVEAAPGAEPSTGTAVPSTIEGDGSAAAGSGRRRRKRK
jgi:pyruvate dehydrogenase E2 component (dihydrolipoyllysine-residue acetyltransferase)